VLDTTDPATILSVRRKINLAKTLFIVASKSGETTETLSHFAYFWEQVKSGKQFAAITDPGTRSKSSRGITDSDGSFPTRRTSAAATRCSATSDSCPRR
jgi:glucose-6-phosphate isomerase